MPGRFHYCILLAAAISSILSAQSEETGPQRIEELLYQHETSVIPEELFEYFEANTALPLDLNQATIEQLEASRLFSPFQLHQLIRYRERFGPLFSLSELAALPGFDTSSLQMLETRVMLNAGSQASANMHGQHLVMFDVGQKHPKSLAYQQGDEGNEQPAYAGSALFTTFRVRSQCGSHLSGGLTYEKDAGEKLFHRGMPQFLSGYLQYQGNAFLKKLVAGTFQLNHGLGLVNGTGFFHHPSSFEVNHRKLSLLRPYASKTEQRYHRGMACQLAHKHVELLLWGSFTHHDLSPVSLRRDTVETPWWEHQRTTGLHRSPGELAGHHLAGKISSGIQLLYLHRDFALGMMTGAERWFLTRQGLKELGDGFDPVNLQYASLHGTWQMDKWQLCGELAAGKSPSFDFAFQWGARAKFNDFIQGTLLIHHYGKGYKGSLPSSYASGSQVQNERGVALHFHLEPGPAMEADVTAEIFQYPFPRYRTLVPTQAYRMTLNLQNPRTGPWQWRVRMVEKSWQSTPSMGNTGARPLKESRLNRFDVRLIHETGKHFSWQSRWIFSFLSPSTEPMPALAALLRVDIRASSQLQASMQFVWFRVEEWEARIYLHEPSFYYSFSFPCYYGRGQKNSFLLTLNDLKKITFSAKLSGITYYDRKESGSGADLVNGNRMWETALQLRLKF
jgi:DNA uptake protein ComE-like DNA-binding protein